MNRFVVISPHPDQIREAVQAKFPNHHFQITDGVWAVASATPLPSDICKTLGINGESTHAGVVLELAAYNGFYNPTLWEKLNLWAQQ